jgi:hypothetical protein
MNSKELLEQARAKAETELRLADQIQDAESTIEKIKGGKICFYVVGCGTVHIDDVVDPEKHDVIRELGLVAIMNFRDDKTAELEQLLGIRDPEPILPMFRLDGSVDLDKLKEVVLAPDPVEDKLTEILQEEAKRIEQPEKKDNRKKYPENMTEEAVRKMYVDQGMKSPEIADYFGVPTKKVENFITIHKLSRKKKQPAETERP